MQPRLTAWYAKSEERLRYSGIEMLPHRWNETLIAINDKISPVAEEDFNGILLNLYRNGSDSMGWHRDNEKELGEMPIIASVSLGATRTFKMRHREEKDLKVSLELQHGSLLIMKGSTQEFWEHAVTKTAKAVRERINLTFRKVVS